MKIAVDYTRTHTERQSGVYVSASSGVGNCYELCYSVLISPLLLHLTSVFLLVCSS